MKRKVKEERKKEEKKTEMPQKTKLKNGINQQKQKNEAGSSKLVSQKWWEKKKEAQNDPKRPYLDIFDKILDQKDNKNQMGNFKPVKRAKLITAPFLESKPKQFKKLGCLKPKSSDSSSSEEGEIVGSDILNQMGNEDTTAFKKKHENPEYDLSSKKQLESKQKDNEALKSQGFLQTRNFYKEVILREISSYDKNPRFHKSHKSKEIVFKFSYLDLSDMTPMISDYLIGNVMSVGNTRVSIKIRDDFYDPENENQISKETEIQAVLEFEIGEFAEYYIKRSENMGKVIEIPKGEVQDEKKENPETPRQKFLRIQKVKNDQRIYDQIEFYFSDKNYSNDTYLLNKAALNEEKFIEIKDILSFNKIKKMRPVQKDIKELMSQSKIVLVSECGNLIKKRTI